MLHDFEVDPKGHVWETNEDGTTDLLALDMGFHNGPRCVNCGYAFCMHCRAVEAACTQIAGRPAPAGSEEGEAR